MKRDLTVNLGNLLLSLSEITDIANPSIAQHQYRTAFIALEIAKNANASPQMLKNIFTAALLHDIGAISIEEKAALHSFVEMDYDLHCIRGEMLFARTPWLKPLAKIIRYHHRNWCNWDAPISDPTVFSAQVILLADFIERSIDKGKYILHQNEEITERVIELKDTVLHPELLDCFKDLAKKRSSGWICSHPDYIQSCCTRDLSRRSGSAGRISPPSPCYSVTLSTLNRPIPPPIPRALPPVRRNCPLYLV